MDGTNNQGPVFAPLPTDPLGGGIINAFLGLISKGKKDNRPKLKQMPGAFADVDENVFGKDLADAFKTYNKRVEVADSALASRNKEYKFDNPVAILSQGKLGGVKITKEVIQDAVDAARKANVNPMDLLAVMAQESTFSQSKVKDQFRFPDQQSMVSGWNVDEKYEPYKLERFLADKQIPGISAKKKYGKIHYSIEDLDKVKEAIKKRPGLMQQYMNKVNKTPIAEESYLDMAAKFIKEKGLQGYNPGDPNYVKDVMNSKALLQRDPQLMKYLKSIKL